ncbi:MULTISPECIES: carboxylesterase [unclassified Spirosoma]|uniref:alpha/beta hydrolase n=1 Tax=unclassified Spirosoma TaxID=2621999 RepID=UPI00095C8ED5|nr:MULTISPECIES: alpha/beta hydrolase [unclassified Spirosoma]MBN8825392.1 alpha/beta fold hydrolase [Spirosoma sp.]OJW74906.1 MAG: alpha/beta hydrolase [Spirosoma sp. 48-14]
MKRLLAISGLILIFLGIGYWVGPTAHPDAVKDEVITLDPDLVKLEQRIAESEHQSDVRPDNEARIVWADSLHKVKTPYSIVYLPGFSASWAEGDPIHREIAKRFGCNLYLARPAEHGINAPDAFKNITPANYAASAEQALAIGKALGEKVIVMGTSAGGMLSLYLAAHHPEIDGLILYSPCIAVANPALKLVTGPWGKQILDLVFRGDYLINTHYSGERSRYWLPKYHTNGLITLQTMLNTYMTPEQFQQVKQPVFLGYYYKDEDHQDQTVSVAAMLKMYDELGTPADKKRKEAFPDAGAHVIASHFTSKDLPGVYRATEAFMSDVLKLPQATTSVAGVAFSHKGNSTKK